MTQLKQILCCVLFYLLALGSAHAVRVYDCFPFFNELERLDIRLHELDEVVDQFILVEATTTHQGNPKPLYFNENKARYKKFLHKIKHVIIDLPKDRNFWVPEKFQRDYISRILKKLRCRDQDIVFVTDLDEIPRASMFPQIIQQLSKDPICFLELARFDYYLNGFVPYPWHQPYVAKWSRLKNASLTQVRHSIQFPNNYFVMKNAGWHFTYLGSAKKLLEKTHAIVEGAPHLQAKDEFSSESGWQNRIDSRIGIDGTRLQFLPIDHTFPRYVQEHIDELAEKGLIGLPYDNQ